MPVPRRAVVAVVALISVALSFSVGVIAGAPAKPPKVKPGKPSSKTLKSHKAPEAIARKAGIKRALDSDESRRSTLRPPLPVFSSPGGDPSIVPPVLSDQFEDGYYEGELPPVPAASCSSVEDPRRLEPAWLSTEKAAGCADTLAGSPAASGPGVGVLSAPYPELVWRSPLDGGVWSGQAGTIDFHDKYGDFPDQNDGWLWFRVFGGSGDVLGGQARGNTTVAGGQSTWFPGTGLGSGQYFWEHWAQDVTGEETATRSDPWALYVNGPPGAPSPVSPQAGATLPTLQPVLSVSGVNPDPEGDYVAWEYKLTSDGGCSTEVVSSGWLPMGATNWTPPLGALKDGRDYYWCVRATDFVGRHFGSADGPFSAARLLKIRLPKRGSQPYWPMFSRGPLSVNEATGNLVIGVPGPSFASAAGSIGGDFTYNLFDTRGSVFSAAAGSAWTTGLAGVPAKLVDHNLLSGDDKFDAVERVEADGTSSYYAHVAGGNTYQAAAGDASILAKTTAGFVLTDPDGSIYTFGVASGATGVAPLAQAQVSSAVNGQAQIDYTFDASGRPTLIVAKAKDAVGTLQTLQTLTYTWACAGALLCITGPDAKQWRYAGDAGGGSSGRLATVTNGTREILRIGYDASGRPNSVKSANDLNPAAASPGHTSTHELQVAYDAAGKVASVIEKAVRDRYYSATSRDLSWSFAYSPAGSATCPLSSRTAHAPDPGAGHTSAVRTIAGCTDVTLPEPKASNGAPNRISVFYDNLAHPVETVDALGTYTLTQWNDRNTPEWTEDELKQPTDYAYDAFTFTPTSVTGPDPDGAGPLPRPVTRQFYDEQAPGNGSTAGPALQGLQAFYYKNADLTGRPETIQNDANVDFDWTVSGPTALGGQKTNIGVRWTGIVTVPAQADYVLATRAEAGTRLVVDGAPLIDTWTGQAFATPQCSPLLNLKAGRHWITLEYHQTAGTDTRVQLLWTNGGTATCANATTVVPSSALTPNWQNETSTITFGSSTSGGANRLAFSHYDKPASRQPDYSAADATGARPISSFSYDNFGRPTQRVLPKGNANRTIAANGDLTGAVVSGYDVSYGYYPIGEPASACGGAGVNQLGLPKSITPYGIAPTTTTYDAVGRPIATTKSAGTTCRVFDGEGRLTSEQAPGEAQATTYTYDPAGLLRTVTNASGTLTTVYNESGQVIGTTDSFGAEMEVVYNKDGNPTKRRVATGPLASSTVYDTDYRYNDDGQLVKQIFLPAQANAAARTYEFSWDARGLLKATRYPNGTFSWNDYLANGALQNVFNQHGTLSSPPPSSGSAPADANALSDFAYSYFADGRRAAETRTGQGLGGGETTSYGYDTVGRLSSVSGALSRSYCYDLDSNRTKLFTTSSSGDCSTGSADVSYAYSSAALDRLATVTPSGGNATSFGYDADGQTTARGADTLGWDSRGRHSGGSFNSPIPLTGVQFTLDGANQGAAVTTTPYQTTLNTSSLATGWHTIGATATTATGKTASAPTRVLRKAAPVVSPTVYGAAMLGDTTGPALTSASLTTTAGADVVLSGFAQDQVGSNGLFAASAPAGLSLLGQGWGANQIGAGLFEEVRAVAGAGSHTVSQGGGGAPSHGGAGGILALHAPSGVLVRRGVATAASAGGFLRGSVVVNRPPNLVAGDLIVAAIGHEQSASTFTLIAPDSSWTSRGILRSTGGEGQTLALFTKVAGANEPSSYNFSVSGAGFPGGLENASVAVAYGVSSGDSTPPSVPGTPTVSTGVAGKASLSWAASIDASSVYYRLHRSTVSGFTPGPANEIAQTSLTGYTDSGAGSTHGLPAGGYYYKLVAVDMDGNSSAASGQGAGTVSADPLLPRLAFAAPTPASPGSVSGIVTLQADATPPSTTSSVSYGFDPAGFRRTRTVATETTRFLLGGLIETTTSGTITGFDVDGPAGDLAHYTSAPSSAVNPSYSYYSGHGDLAAEADQNGSRTRLLRLDPWGQPLAAPGGADLQELFTGRWDKKHDQTSGLIEMGVRPYDPALGRFLAVDPVDGGSANVYDYALQDPINSYDLSGKCTLCLLAPSAAIDYLFSHPNAFWGASRVAAIDYLSRVAPQAGFTMKWTTAQGSPAVEFSKGSGKNKSRILIERAGPKGTHPSVTGKPAIKPGTTYIKFQQGHTVIARVELRGGRGGGGGNLHNMTQ